MTKQIQDTIEKACKRIAPSWTLENSVAVNPFLGVSEISFHEAAKRLYELGDVRLYMPLKFYKAQIKSGEINIQDINKALKKNKTELLGEEFLAKLSLTEENHLKKRKNYTLLDVAEEHFGNNFSEIMIDYTSVWLSQYFNEKTSGQKSSEEMFLQWKKDASLDFFPELMGVREFRKSINALPQNSTTTILMGLRNLNVPENGVETYLHALLLKTLGWSSYCAGIDWQNKLYGKPSNFTQTLLAIIIAWEISLQNIFNELDNKWLNTLKNLTSSPDNSNDDQILAAKAILQDAFDFAFQRNLRGKFNVRNQAQIFKNPENPIAQMVFCIDVRSEIYRRQLEAVNKKIETIGFAGFFGFPVRYKPINHVDGKNQCPVLIPSGPKIFETTCHPENFGREKRKRVLSGKMQLAWSKFKAGSVSSFGFVSTMGVFYLLKLIGDSLGWTKPTDSPKQKEFGKILSGQGKLDLSNISLTNRVSMAKSALIGMGLTKNFAPLVLITGHGSSSVNNPHASGLDCGACGGNSGEINAITAQNILNDTKVREELKEFHIVIPKETLFLACIHNTTTDEIKIIDEKIIPQFHLTKVKEIKESLTVASKNARVYRSHRLGIHEMSVEKEVGRRANDWSQVRPEWGLAGCSSFIVANREKTCGLDLEGRAFLHSYNWKTDTDSKVLEAIITAPMIVTSWINLQYYASTVDNKRLGAGNKTLHNATSGLGVLEGAKGDLRIGLPIQSVHDGTNYQHLPIRLNVVIEAPKERIVNLLEKHLNIKELFVNEWIYLFIMSDDGKITHRYNGYNNLESYINKTKVLEHLHLVELN